MPFVPIALAAAGLAALLALVSKKPSTPAAGNMPIPDQSDPVGSEFAGKVPVQNVAKAASGRVYTVWFWPEVTGGTYTVARLAGTTAWISFMFNKNTGQSAPVKTNVMQLPITDAEKAVLLTNFRTDWRLPS